MAAREELTKKVLLREHEVDKHIRKRVSEENKEFKAFLEDGEDKPLRKNPRRMRQRKKEGQNTNPDVSMIIEEE